MIFFCFFYGESPWITLIRSLLSELRKTSNFLCIKKHYTIVLKSRPRNASYELIFWAECKNIRFQFLIILLTVKLLCIFNNVWKIWNRCLRTIFFQGKRKQFHTTSILLIISVKIIIYGVQRDHPIACELKFWYFYRMRIFGEPISLKFTL